MARRPIAPVLVAAIAVAVFVWWSLAPTAAIETLTAYRSGLYLEPWRAISSCFLHYQAPHLLFNLATLWILGARVVQRYGTRWFVVCFLVGAFVGQIVHTLLGPGHVYGISGGVCGLYGFLIRREWKGTLTATLRAWPLYWIYPLALVGLFFAELLIAVPVANVNHVAGIATGWLLAAGYGSGAKRYWRFAADLVIASIILLSMFRPWDPVWQAVHGRYDAGAVLPSIPCDESIDPPGAEVAFAPPLMVTVLNATRRRLVLEYLDADGRLVETLRTRARARDFRPLAGSVWRVSDRDAGCVGQFIAERSGVVVVRND